MSRSWIRGLTIACVVLVAAVAAVVSYAHMYELALEKGEGWRSNLIPLSVDGMLVATTLAIVDRRRLGQAVGWVPWTGLALGLVASLGANVAGAQSDLVAQLVAAWPPVALAISIETLVIVLRNTRKPRAASAPKAAPDSKPVQAAAVPASSAPAKQVTETDVAKARIAFRQAEKDPNTSQLDLLRLERAYNRVRRALSRQRSESEESSAVND